MLSQALIRDRLSRYDFRDSVDDHQTADWMKYIPQVSVLIPIFMKNEKPHVLLTIRSENVKDPGRVVFPGGKVDTTDEDVTETALREASEEIGLPSQMAEVVANFQPGIILPNYLAHSVVAIIPDTFVPKACESEVARVFSLPLERFLMRDGRTSSRHQIGSFSWDDFVFSDVIEGGASVVTSGYTSIMCMIVAMIVFDRDAAPFSSGQIINVLLLQSYLLNVQSLQSHL